MMLRMTTALATVALLVGLTGPVAAKKTRSTARQCPVCHMKLSSKKTAANPTPVRIAGRTYYCCAKCPMHKKA